MSEVSLEVQDVGGDCPYAVQLAADNSIRPTSVYCEFDGAGAGGSFYLTLTILSPSGVVVSTTRCPDELASGDTGVATFAPFLGREASVVPPPVAAFVPYVILELSGDYNVWKVTETPGQDPAQVSTDTFDQRNTPRLSPDGTRLAYERWPGGFSEVWVMDADGSGDTLLDNAGGATFVQWPNWRPDSGAIVYTISNVGSNAGGDIYRIGPTGAGKTLLYAPGVPNACRWPAYSPDGTLIAFTRHYDGFSPGVGVRQLCVMNADGTGFAILDTLVNVNQDQPGFAWANGQNTLAYYTGNSGATIGGVYRIEADGTGKTLLATTSNTVWLQAIGDRAWSPDDSTVYIGAREVGGLGLAWYIKALAADGSGEAFLSPERALFSSPVFQMPFVFGQRIYYVPTGDTSLRSTALDGSDDRLEQLLSTGGVGDLFYIDTGIRGRF